ncbi:RNA polymerase II associated Paf1 complex [Schizosaccharomyces japonicus yFS275]|uniref:RNA polymerase II associated Paf1 complex n=1 Tax=Schizosaccharomyces japonicus (strain yFS275 / FY16936) TaxID=402676 RepID=B6K856_SCHJY|nr:RNA polymerase II associated Paf1 complex [Schizosaccharomyces japonicus yFS275]EEB09710.1 RNA polymerase II associated Paf1 complex [Schizosaccharomyces japonicus yFS275]
MADFQDELLALAGVDDSLNSSKSRKRALDNSDDSFSDSDEEHNNELNDFEASDNEGYEEDDEKNTYEEELLAFENPYRLEGKFRDEEDRARLMAMTEVERESILYEREEEIAKLNERRELAVRLRKQKEQYSQTSARRSTREKLTSETAGKRDKLTELKKRRQERSNKVNTSARKEVTEKAYSTSEDEASYSEQESDAYSEGYSPRIVETQSAVTLDDVNTIRLGRKHIVKYMFHPLFESCTVGCFVRVKIGERHGESVYRLCQIKGISKGKKAYRVEGSLTNVMLECTHGRYRRAFDISVLSNEPFSQHDFDRWQHQLEEDHLRPPRKDFFKKHLEGLQRMASYILNDTEVSEVVRIKRELSRIPSNISAEKTNLRMKRQAALAANQMDLVQELDERLNTLEELSMGSRPNGTSTLDQLSKVNERNRRKNQEEVRLAEKRMNDERRRMTAMATFKSVNSVATDVLTEPSTNAPSNVSSPFTHQTPERTPSLSPKTLSKASTPAVELPSSVKEKNAVLRQKAVNGVDNLIANMDFDIELDI